MEIYKFRSMYDGSDSMPTPTKETKRRPARHPCRADLSAKLSLDELPQLLNVVFIGNMSLVGPRPHAIQAKAAGDHYDGSGRRLFRAAPLCKPGITGWAQVNGWRGETDSRGKILRPRRTRSLLHRKWSILFDFYIVAAHAFRTDPRRRCLLTAPISAAQNPTGACGCPYSRSRCGST